MKQARAMGLVAAGGVTGSFLARIPALLEDLGPIKASSFGVARRIARSLKAGYAVSHYSALETAPLIWIAVPEATLDRVVLELISKTPLGKIDVVICGCTRDSLSVRPLDAAGARVATLNLVPESGDRVFVAEGHRDTVHTLQGLLGRDKRKLIKLKPETKPLFFAGIHFASHLLLSRIAAAMESLRASGFPRADAASAVKVLGANALQAYARAGDRAWSRKNSASLRKVLESELEKVRRIDPKVAALYEQGVREALRTF